MRAGDLYGFVHDPSEILSAGMIPASVGGMRVFVIEFLEVVEQLLDAVSFRVELKRQ